MESKLFNIDTLQLMQVGQVGKVLSGPFRPSSEMPVTGDTFLAVGITLECQCRSDWWFDA